MIKFLDLKKINSKFESEFKDCFNSFLNSGHYILGKQVALFETEYAAYCGTKYCIGVSSGLDALTLILEGYKLMGVFKQGDEIIVPANTYIATVLAITNAGLTPVLIEPELTTYNINTKLIKPHITPKTKAILGVHLYGAIYNVNALEQLCKDHNLVLIEDAAQAHGAVAIDGRKVGNLSHAAAFSFYPTKNLGALGDAGAITTNNTELANILFKLRNYGKETAYKNKIKGFNCRLDEVQAGFLIVKLKHLNNDNKRRQAIANLYLKGIKNSKIELPNAPSNQEHVYHLFVIRTKNRDVLKAYLDQKGIETLIHYPVPVHKQEAYKEYNKMLLPITEQIHDEVLSLPLNTALLNNEVLKVIEAVNSY